MVIQTSLDSKQLMDRLLPKAYEKALEFLGEPAKRELLFRLKKKYSLSSGKKLTLQALRLTADEIFGPDGARLIIEQVWLTLEEIAEADEDLLVAP